AHGRRPAYHAIQTATGGSRWQRFAPDQAIFAPPEDGTFASSCAPSVPYLFHANRPKTGLRSVSEVPGRLKSSAAKWLRVITAMNLWPCGFRAHGDSPTACYVNGSRRWRGDGTGLNLVRFAGVTQRPVV